MNILKYSSIHTLEILYQLVFLDTIDGSDVPVCVTHPMLDTQYISDAYFDPSVTTLHDYVYD